MCDYIWYPAAPWMDSTQHMRADLTQTGPFEFRRLRLFSLGRDGISAYLASTTAVPDILMMALVLVFCNHDQGNRIYYYSRKPSAT